MTGLYSDKWYQTYMTSDLRLTPGVNEIKKRRESLGLNS